MTDTPLGERAHVVIAGLRNAGKSSLFNRLLGRDLAIVSAVAGTTTDPVTQAMELLPFGPIALTDTAGLDETGESPLEGASNDEGVRLGLERVKKSQAKIAAARAVIFVTRADQAPLATERAILESLKDKTVLAALSFSGNPANAEKRAWLSGYPTISVESIENKGFEELKRELIKALNTSGGEMGPLEGLVTEGDLVLLVTPIDLAAPKGRLILPQVETIRDALDRDCAALVVKERELYSFYHALPKRPRLVITDSQAFNKVSADIPQDQALTSFSILFARKKGDLAAFTEALSALENFPRNGKVLVLESCSHHRQADDIGTVKIPRLFRQLVEPSAEFLFARELPEAEALADIKLVIGCAACMVQREAVLARLSRLRQAGVPMTNYGVFLAWSNGLIPRALEPLRRAVPLS
jgi:[FeFe] hydrogenase H-cluster maturation GTPase HydF